MKRILWFVALAASLLVVGSVARAIPTAWRAGSYETAFVTVFLLAFGVAGVVRSWLGIRR